jgi:hypothetical protein
MTANPSLENPCAAASTQDVRGSGLSVASGSLICSPRTDAEALWPASNDDSDTKDPSGAYVLADFARILESENREMLRVIESLVMQLEHVEWLRAHQNGPVPSTLTPEILASAKKLLANVTDHPRE